RRGQLIEAGLEGFGTVGYAHATVKMICAEAGLTERYFYESFANREAFFGAVYDRVVEIIGGLMDEAIEAAPQEPEAKARALIDTYFDKIEADPKFARILLLEVIGVSHELESIYRAAMQLFTDLVRDRLPELLQAAVARKADPEVVAAGLVGAIVHVAMRWVISDYEKSREDMTQGLMEIFRAVAQES
ncbi:TetR/AcrR family transcriptional regulator, partial [Parvibaculum sp.]|uniref:TetR/AcrR family transcriptional regulator n=1 Tax=Parvibaculum sp. TaxID=2024848 RepID=UPI000C8A2072